MSRVGKYVDLDENQVLARSMSLAAPWRPGPDQALPQIFYFLDAQKGMRNGGRDPAAPHCASVWTDGNGKVWATADCVAFAMWSLGVSRWHHLFGEYGGAVNTDSMLLDADDETPTFFRRSPRPLLGHLIVTPSIYVKDPATKKTKRIPGHVGVVVGVPADWDVDADIDDQAGDLHLVKVAHCSPSNQHGPAKQAIAITNANVFGRRSGWGFLEFVGRPLLRAA